MGPTITRIEIREFEYPLENIGTDENEFNLVYEPGSTLEANQLAFKIHTDVDVTGEYVLVTSIPSDQFETYADYLIGKNPLKRERHWSEIERALRNYDRMGIGPLDIALWDFAGKDYDAPIHKLLGTYQTEIPAYASTYHGDENDRLDSPEAFADFAEKCLKRGFPGFKLSPSTAIKNSVSTSTRRPYRRNTCRALSPTPVLSPTVRPILFAPIRSTTRESWVQ